MCITGPDEIVDSWISLPVSPITNYRVPARSVLAALLPLCYFERCNSADLAVGTKGRRGRQQGLVSRDHSLISNITVCLKLCMCVLFKSFSWSLACVSDNFAICTEMKIKFCAFELFLVNYRLDWWTNWVTVAIFTQSKVLDRRRQQLRAWCVFLWCAFMCAHPCASVKWLPAESLQVWMSGESRSYVCVRVCLSMLSACGERSRVFALCSVHLSACVLSCPQACSLHVRL